ncbi:hypothetical protein [Terricaulis sp.]|nr:hypothetical protein [Terricaulis sp.]MDZ4691621.1 hypothetical protein [Terricaulis sp.]
MAKSTTAETENRASSAGLPAIGAIILTVIWGAYTLLVLYEILMTPLPG